KVMLGPKYNNMSLPPYDPIKYKGKLSKKNYDWVCTHVKLIQEASEYRENRQVEKENKKCLKKAKKNPDRRITAEELPIRIRDSKTGNLRPLKLSDTTVIEHNFYSPKQTEEFFKNAIVAKDTEKLLRSKNIVKAIEEE